MTEMKMPQPVPPVGLADRGAAFWHKIHATWILNADESELVTECCRLLDTVEALQLVLDRDGVLTTGSTGQTRVHPAVGELRACRVVLARLMGQIGLPDPTGAAVPTASTVRARRAARARWGGEMPHRRDLAEQGEPPAHLLSLPVWILERRSQDPALARSEWEQARSEWGRGAPTLDALNGLYGPGFSPGPEPDPRGQPGHDARGRTR